MFIMEKIIFNRIRKALEEAGVDFEAEDKPEVVKVNKYFNIGVFIRVLY